jgi:hypothetical protein
MGKKDGSGIPNAAFVLDDDDISGKGPAALAVQQNKQPLAITAGSPDVFSSAEVSVKISLIIHLYIQILTSQEIQRFIHHLFPAER